MNPRVEKINLWLKDRSTDVGMVVICGMGGVGKTTAAKFVFDSNYRSFDGSSFLGNIREVSKDRLVRLQRQLLSDILHKEEKKIFSVGEGRNRIQYALCNKRVLLVLDDVDEVDKLDELLGTRSWLTRGSKIIITTRQERLLNVHEIYRVHRIQRLNCDESLELFSWHAFEKRRPIKDYMDHSKKFVDYCQGLPLALEVLGSAVAGRSLDLWESTLKKLEEIPDTKILEKLEISYDSLQEKKDRDLFLDIACFFVGMNKNDMVAILDGCGYHTALGIQNLIDRNLLTVENNKLGMHHLHQDMGKEIVCKESDNPEDRSRLWRHTESFKILRDKIGTSKIIGLILDMKVLKKTKPAGTTCFCNHSRFLKTDAFKEMRNLRLLKLSYIQLSGTYEVFPKKLRWLYWRGFHLKSLPNGFPLENMVALDMRNSSLQQVWKQSKVLEWLKILTLSHSPHLAKTPNFSRIPNLEKLVLKDCPSLVEVDESIAYLERLVILNLKDCKNLRKLPRNISMVKSLEELNISGCSNLVGAAEELEKMHSLKVLRWTEKPRETPYILSMFLSFLVILSLEISNLIDDAFRSFPKDFAGLPVLQHLSLARNPIRILPVCIAKLKMLKVLDLRNK